MSQVTVTGALLKGAFHTAAGGGAQLADKPSAQLGLMQLSACPDKGT